MTNKFARAALLVGSLALGGCSDIFPYKSGDLAQNVTFTPQLSDGSVRMDVYDLDEKCQQKYQGSVQAGSDPVKLAMPVNQQRYLIVLFHQSSFFGGDHSTSTSVFFKAHPGVMYNIKASYADSMYDVQVLEHSRGAWHKVPEVRPQECGRSR